jgi:thiamine-monophosphate kinase
MALSEFELIQRYFAHIVPSLQNISLGVGDDAALIHIDDNCELALSIDTQQTHTHFPEHAAPQDIAQRAFRCAISDLAAMGARPLCFTLALSLPEADEHWLENFSAGLTQVAQEFSCPLVGGDTTRGSLSITMQMQGSVEKGTAIKRSGAQAGDVIFVSGFLGGAAAYVELLRQGTPESEPVDHARELFHADYYQPLPCIALGRAIKQYATSAIDVSDGLLADLQHICDASGVKAILNVHSLPTRPELQETFTQQATTLALTGGDDYQLCFTVPEKYAHNVIKLGEDMECPLTVIGSITEAANGEAIITCLKQDGSILDISTLANTGYSHF